MKAHRRFLPPILSLHLVLVALVGLACSSPDAPDESLDPETESFTDRKQDSAAACAAEGSAKARGILALVNSDNMTAQQLDRPTSEGGIGLHRTAASNIAAARPFADLRALDDVPFVGPAACAALQRHACDVVGLCDQPIAVMTWNVEHFPLTDETAAQVAAIVRDSGADIVGFQEIRDVDALFDLADDLADYEAFVAEPGPFTRVGALVRLSAGGLQNVQDLFVSDSRAFPRPPLAISIELRTSAGPRRVTFVIVHLKARVDADSQQRRREAIAALETWIDDESAAGRDRTVVLGDFNDQLTDASPFNVFEPLLGRPDDYTFLTAELAAAGEFSFLPFRSLIDHVVATAPVLSVFGSATARVLRPDLDIDDFEHRVSDHLPVLIELN